MNAHEVRAGEQEAGVRSQSSGSANKKASCLRSVSGVKGSAMFFVGWEFFCRLIPTYIVCFEGSLKPVASSSLFMPLLVHILLQQYCVCLVLVAFSSGTVGQC